jgi:calcium-activated chloride channel regulator 3/4
MYGASGWETLARKVSEDPRDGKRAALPVRLYYPELAGVAPAANTSPLPILPGTARSDLEIIWATRDTTFQIVIDNSGSMGWGSGSPMENAKAAAKFLVDLAEIDHATIGVIKFSTNAEVVIPLTPIVDQAAKDAIKTAINGISSTNMTNITEGAQLALDNILAFPDAEETTRVVYLLSDGGHTEGAPYPESVIPAYQAAGIPLFTFGYGSYADPGLTKMAQDTGGQFYQSPTTLEDLQLVFQDAAQLSSSTVGLVAGSGTVSSAQLSEFPVLVDASISRLTVSVSYVGAEADIDPLNLRKPDNSLSDAADCSVSGSEVLCLFTVENAVAGTWKLEAGASADDVELSYRVSGTAIDQTTFYAALHSVMGTEVQYPEPIVLMAYLGKEAPISGAGVTGTITKPDGTTATFTLNDDGVAPDVFADDGIYSALLAYDQNGVHTITIEFDNDAGTAKTNYSGLIPAIGPDGNPAPIQDPVPVTEDFTRFSRLQVTVVGHSTDDHGDTTPMATTIATDNEDVAGRIDTPDDLDMFSFAASEDGTLVVRIANFGFGMNPRLRLIAANGTDILEDVNLSTNATDRGYLALSIQTSAYDSFFAEVSDLDGKEGGIYSISVGSSISSDDVQDVGPKQIFLPLVLQ